MARSTTLTGEGIGDEGIDTDTALQGVWAWCLRQAGYWKSYYNTRLGKGTVEGYMDKWRAIVEPWL